jgi:hypothetical protein
MLGTKLTTNIIGQARRGVLDQTYTFPRRKVKPSCLVIRQLQTSRYRITDLNLGIIRNDLMLFFNPNEPFLVRKTGTMNEFEKYEGLSSL